MSQYHTNVTNHTVIGPESHTEQTNFLIVHEPMTTQGIKHILKLYKLTYASSTWWSRLVHIVFGWKEICSSLASESDLLQLHVCYEDSLLLCKL